MAGPRVEGLVGTQPAVSHPGVRVHPPSPAGARDGGRHTCHFLDATPAEALEQARQAAAGLDVRINGPSTIRQFLAADLIDYLHIVVVPIVLGRGGTALGRLEALDERFQAEAVSSPSGVTHLTFTRR
jgi:dihydrofolate reductase